MAVSDTINVTLVYASGPRNVTELCLALPLACTARGAVIASGWLQKFPELKTEQEASLSIWGRKASWNQTLRDGDRVEFCRALRVDPKVARRERFSRQGTRTAGLFAQRREGAKPGY
jgi:uncharacterized protein